MGARGARGPAAGPAFIGIVAIAVLAAVTRATKPLLNGPDPFWHWDLGRRIIAEGLPRSDPYSFLTEGQDWILNQWGTEALIGMVDRFGGLWLVAAFAALLVGGVYLHVGWHMWRRCPSLLTVGLLGLVYMAGMRNLALRGNLLTFLLLPLMLWEVQRDEAPRLRVVLPLMLVWANVHAGFLIGVAILVVHGAGELLRARGPDRLRLAVSRAGIVLAALAATLLTPYGPRLLAQVLQLTTRGGQSGISEWRPPELLSLDILPFTVLVAVTLLALAIAAGMDDISDALLVVAFAILGMATIRNVAPAAIVVGIVGAPHVYRAARALRRMPEKTLAPGHVRLPDRVLGVTLVVVGGVLSFLVPPRSGAVAAHVADMPLATIRALDDADRAARVVTTTFWAPAVAILTHDRVRTGVDGRLELFDAEALRSWSLVNSADPGWEEQLEEWCVTDAIVAAGTPLHEVLADSGEAVPRETAPLTGMPDDQATWFVLDPGDCPEASG